MLLLAYLVILFISFTDIDKRRWYYSANNHFIIYYVIFLLLLLLSTHSLDPCCWGESDHPAFGPPASLSLHLASRSITPSGYVHKSTSDSVVRMWVQLKRWCVSCVWVLQRGPSGDGCDLASTLCKYDLRKGDLFVLRWERVRRVRRRRISSALLMCGGGVHIILLLPLVAICLETIDVYACLFLCLL